jgi:hypothetical protein
MFLEPNQYMKRLRYLNLSNNLKLSLKELLPKLAKVIQCNAFQYSLKNFADEFARTCIVWSGKSKGSQIICKESKV